MSLTTSRRGWKIGFIKGILIDHDKVFKNERPVDFCTSHDISHEFSAPKTTQ